MYRGPDEVRTIRAPESEESVTPPGIKDVLTPCQLGKYKWRYFANDGWAKARPVSISCRPQKRR